MLSITVVSEETEKINKLCAGLTSKGLHCSVVRDLEGGVFNERKLDLVLVIIDGLHLDSAILRLPQEIKQKKHLPVIALLSNEALDNLEFITGIDDFVVEPWGTAEVVARVKLILQLANNNKDADKIKCGDLTIDVAKCEVRVCDRPVMLTFKEYQLLRFLISNRGKVFTRDALLNKVWGYDYFGGDRTVDVHIRRLRCKLEDASQTFIETVRNIGYRFREDS